MMNRQIQLQQILLTSGEVVEVASGVTAIVGPNNTGKSSLLRELREQLNSDPRQHYGYSKKVVEAPVLDFVGSVEEQIEELARAYTRRPPGQYNEGLYHEDSFRLFNGSVITESQVRFYWQVGSGLGVLGGYFVTYLDAESRLGQTGDTGSYDSYREVPSSPLQVLYANREIEQRISELSDAAFKIGITVNRHAGSMIHLHAGTTALQEGVPPQSAGYLAELNALPLVHSQGDGMRAFLGMLMAVLTGKSPLVLIDEPEAFLHPPQARMFGRFLAEYASEEEGVQVIIATHSEDIIAGMTSATGSSAHLSIARLTRNKTSNHVAQLKPSVVAELYADPLMKHYDMLNGLFSTGVVLCEADSDCTYFRAVLDSPGVSVASYAREAHFTHAGGKARIARAMGAFRAAAVPVAAVFDIDILQNEKEFYTLVEAIGADRVQLEPLRNTVVSAVEARTQNLRRAAVRADIASILDRTATRDLSKADARKIQEAAAQRSGWKDLKLSGAALLSGDALGAYSRLVEHLELFGVFLVEQGELERLHPSIPQGNKAEWLRKVIDTRAYVGSPSVPMLGRISAFLEVSQTQVGATPDA